MRRAVIAIVAALLLPAVGAAGPVVAPPALEQLVEGHVVFGVIEAARATTTLDAEYAAAVAVLVREYDAAQRAFRFPGVLWFNDQYLVNPTAGQDPASRLPGDDGFRYPCGGAVLAVNRGDPDPRVAVLRYDAEVADAPAAGDVEASGAQPAGSSPYGSDASWLNASAAADADANDDATPGDAAGGAAASSDTLVGATVWPAAGPSALPPWEYNESYYVTDPNDHAWMIDKYDFYARDAVATDPLALAPRATLGTYTVWVVNMYGSAAFAPDDGDASCIPFADVIDCPTTVAGVPVNAVTDPVCGNPDDGVARVFGGDQGRDGLPLDAAQSRGHETLCGAGVPNGYDGTRGPIGSEPYADDPCAGYAEPGASGYCYGGQDPAATDQGGPAGCADRADNPLRTYNALLYVRLRDLRVEDAPRDHSPTTTPGGDTNGCHASYGTYNEWPCPVDERGEGNSHPFHPTTTHDHDGSVCPPGFGGANPTNHGGSTSPTNACDYAHATRQIDLYFGGRPAPPVVRKFTIFDVEGSSAPYHDHHAAYP